MGKRSQPIELLVHLVHHVFPIDHDRFVRAVPKRDVQHGTILGSIESFAGKHGVDRAAQVRLFGQLQQQRHGFVGDSILRVVQIEIAQRYGISVRPFRVVLKKIAEVNVFHFFVVRVQGAPRRFFVGHLGHDVHSFSTKSIFAPRGVPVFSAAEPLTTATSNRSEELNKAIKVPGVASP